MKNESNAATANMQVLNALPHFLNIVITFVFSKIRDLFAISYNFEAGYFCIIVSAHCYA